MTIILIDILITSFLYSLYPILTRKKDRTEKEIKRVAFFNSLLIAILFMALRSLISDDNEYIVGTGAPALFWYYISVSIMSYNAGKQDDNFDNWDDDDDNSINSSSNKDEEETEEKLIEKDSENNIKENGLNNEKIQETRFIKSSNNRFKVIAVVIVTSIILLAGWFGFIKYPEIKLTKEINDLETRAESYLDSKNYAKAIDCYENILDLKFEEKYENTIERIESDYKYDLKNLVSYIYNGSSDIETVVIDISTLWWNTIYSEKDEYNNGNYDFNVAINNYWDSDKYSDLSSEIFINQSTIDGNYDILENPPKKYASTVLTVKEMYMYYADFKVMSNKINSSYNEYTENKSDLTDKIINRYNSISVDLK